MSGKKLQSLFGVSIIMRSVIALIGILIFFPANAQLTSIAGITPGKTTLEELKVLVRDPKKLEDSKNSSFFVGLSQLDNKMATVSLQNGTVYKVEVMLFDSEAMLNALFQKYGEPTRKIGKLGTTKCSNKMGATFEYLSGTESLLWPAKNGIQALLKTHAFGDGCSELIGRYYILMHIETVEAINKKSAEEARRKSESAINKIKDAL
ncbi:MAG: hypothetical protein LBU43_00495 [Candidatus Accumulibacter sp.]|jgi:hypothetical protein|nr:hypothetical protein [Accumulibacter sp.]